MQEQMRKLSLIKGVKAAWTLMALAVLLVTLRHDVPSAPNDIGVFLAWGMLVLTFPAGLLVVFLAASVVFLQEEFGVPLMIVLDHQYIGVLFTSIAFFVAAYLQWFVLLPWLFRKWKRRRSV